MHGETTLKSVTPLLWNIIHAFSVQVLDCKGTDSEVGRSSKRQMNTLCAYNLPVHCHPKMAVLVLSSWHIKLVCSTSRQNTHYCGLAIVFLYVTSRIVLAD